MIYVLGGILLAAIGGLAATGHGWAALALAVVAGVLVVIWYIKKKED